jgi:hypothetical protein
MFSISPATLVHLLLPAPAIRAEAAIAHAYGVNGISLVELTM